VQRASRITMSVGMRALPRGVWMAEGASPPQERHGPPLRRRRWRRCADPARHAPGRRPRRRRLGWRPVPRRPPRPFRGRQLNKSGVLPVAAHTHVPVKTLVEGTVGPRPRRVSASPLRGCCSPTPSVTALARGGGLPSALWARPRFWPGGSRRYRAGPGHATHESDRSAARFRIGGLRLRHRPRSSAAQCDPRGPPRPRNQARVQAPPIPRRRTPTTASNVHHPSIVDQ
jgi:hypothetical protein